MVCNLFLEQQIYIEETFGFAFLRLILLRIVTIVTVCWWVRVGCLLVFLVGDFVFLFAD